MSVAKQSQKFCPAADPLPGDVGRPKFNQLHGDGHCLYLQTQFGEDRCTQFRVIVVTEPPTQTYPPTHPPTHRQDRLQYIAPQLERSVITFIIVDANLHCLTPALPFFLASLTDKGLILLCFLLIMTIWVRTFCWQHLIRSPSSKN